MKADFTSSLYAEGAKAQRSGMLASLVSLFTSSGTLLCCALPALLVAVGAGAALSSLISVVPQLVWVSEHKLGVFVFAALMLMIAGILQWQSRHAPCPVDPKLRDACLRARKTSLRVYGISVLLFLIGGWFAFVQPLL